MTDFDFARIVAQHYEPLYRFASSLTRDKAESWDLTQQTFCIWATKGHQLRDLLKVKTWLFTTLYREFLGSRRRQNRFPHIELDETAPELPVTLPEATNRLDTQQVLVALGKLEAIFQAPVALFYLENYSYKEIAEILDVPIGTVKSRLTRGIGQLQRLLFRDIGMGQST
jgi:RNA polymerase sigma factor (sigma-70 family)